MWTTTATYLYYTAIRSRVYMPDGDYRIVPPRRKGSERRKIVFAIGVCTALFLLGALAIWWVKEESVAVDFLYDEPARITVYFDDKVLASENLSTPGPFHYVFSCSTSAPKGSHTVRVVEENTGATASVRIDVYGSLWVIADVFGGAIRFQVTSTQPVYL